MGDEPCLTVHIAVDSHPAISLLAHFATHMNAVVEWLSWLCIGYKRYVFTKAVSTISLEVEKRWTLKICILWINY